MSNTINQQGLESSISALSEKELLQAMEANLFTQMTHFAKRLPQIELLHKPGITLVNSGLPDDSFNYVLSAKFQEKDAEETIRTATEYFRQRQVPFSWWFNPLDQPARLGEILLDYGYRCVDNNAGMYFDLDKWDERELSPPSRLKVVRIGAQNANDKAWHDFVLVSANNEAASHQYISWIKSVLTNEDPLEYYVGYDVHGQPVVSALLCCFAGVVGLYWLATAPHEQRKGYATLMQYYMFKRAKDLGYHIMVLEASDQGYPLYQRLGYKECGLFREYKINL